MEEYEIKNAVIAGTGLGFLGHNIFQMSIDLDYGNSCHQSFGGYALSHGNKGSIYGCEAIMRVLKVLEIERWEDLKGTPVRVEARDDHIKRMGHYLKDKWIDFVELGKEITERES